MAGITLDPFVDRYAERTRGMTASEIRALFSVASRPEVVSLAGGMPNLSALPLDAVGELVRDLVAQRGTAALQYGQGQGEPTLREHICQVMALEGIQGSPDDVVVTVGSQQGLDLVSRVFLDPGDVVLAEGPSYVGALGTFQSAQAEVVHVDMDDDGIDPAGVREALDRLAKLGKRVKFLYTVPNFHNPAGISLSDSRRDELVAIADERDLLIIEDNPYGLLGFDEAPRRALRARGGNRVVYLGSFSKTFSPGLRVGWVLAPHAVRERLVLMSEAQVLCPPSFSQFTVCAYLETMPWREQIKTFCELYRERRDACLDALGQLFPASARWTTPTGGFYVWVTLPEGLDSKAMLSRAVQQRVAYVPGTGFYADGRGASHLRLSYCYPEPDRIREGVRRLAAVLEAESETQAEFGVALPDVPHPGSGPATTRAPAADLA